MSASDNENDGQGLAPNGDSATEGMEHLQQIKSSVFNELALNRSLLDQYKKAVDISTIVSKTDPYGVITFVNDEFCRISGYSRDELVGATHTLIRHPETSETLFKDMWRTITRRDVWKGVIKNRCKSGRSYYVDSVIVPMLDTQGKITEFMSIRRDVTDLIEQRLFIERHFTDPLTGLPNRQKLVADLETNDQHSLLLLNISDFSEINEYHGYKVGDQVLRVLASILGNLIDDGSRLYRLAGDEFGVLTPDVLETDEFASLCSELSGRVSQFPVRVGELEFPVNVVIGAGSGSNAFIEADIALHSAQEKQLAYEVYDQNSGLKQRIDDNISWVGRIRDAIAHDRIEVFAQPIARADSGDIDKFECLMRLRDQEGQIHSPHAFLEAAKRARLYDSLTHILIDKAFRFFAHRTEDFSINLTARDIQNPETVELILSQAQAYGLAERLIIEIVESEGIEKFTQVGQFIQRAQEAGCRIAVDDFGTGYSNFEYLLKLNIDIIKVDGSLVQKLETDINTRMLSEMIVGFCQRMDVQTVAEFVHSQALKNGAVAIGFDYMQGYYIGKPTPLDQL